MICTRTAFSQAVWLLLSSEEQDGHPPKQPRRLRPMFSRRRQQREPRTPKPEAWCSSRAFEFWPAFGSTWRRSFCAVDIFLPAMYSAETRSPSCHVGAYVVSWGTRFVQDDERTRCFPRAAAAAPGDRSWKNKWPEPFKSRSCRGHSSCSTTPTGGGVRDSVLTPLTPAEEEEQRTGEAGVAVSATVSGSKETRLFHQRSPETTRAEGRWKVMLQIRLQSPERQTESSLFRSCKKSTRKRKMRRCYRVCYCILL